MTILIYFLIGIFGIFIPCTIIQHKYKQQFGKMILSDNIIKISIASLFSFFSVEKNNRDFLAVIFLFCLMWPASFILVVLLLVVNSLVYLF